MQVDIKQGGDGFRCWNADAIEAFAAATNAREAQLSAANPDVVLIAGRVKCYGCQVNDFDLGVRCTAELTRTLFAVAGEVAPRAADAGGSLADIPDLVSRLTSEQAVNQAQGERPATVATAPVTALTPTAPAAPTASAAPTAPAPRTAPVAPVPPAAAPERRSGLSRLLGRRG